MRIEIFYVTTLRYYLKHRVACLLSIEELGGWCVSGFHFILPAGHALIVSLCVCVCVCVCLCVSVSERRKGSATKKNAASSCRQPGIKNCVLLRSTSKYVREQKTDL